MFYYRDGDFYSFCILDFLVGNDKGTFFVLCYSMRASGGDRERGGGGGSETTLKIQLLILNAHSNVT